MTTTGGRSSKQVSEEVLGLALERFTIEDAVRLGVHALALAQAEKLAIIIEVHHGSRVAFKAALPGSVPDSDQWIARKARVVQRWQKSTLEMRLAAEEKDTTFNEFWLVPESEFGAHGGGIPIYTPGVGMVGGFFASGLPQLDDHDFLVRALRSFS